MHSTECKSSQQPRINIHALPPVPEMQGAKTLSQLCINVKAGQTTEEAAQQAVAAYATESIRLDQAEEVVDASDSEESGSAHTAAQHLVTLPWMHL